MHNFCYVLINNEQKTYVGYTNNYSRRIKQHNGILKGGAKYTLQALAKLCNKQSNNTEWKYLVLLTSTDTNFTKNIALSLEWWIKHPLGKKYKTKEFCGPYGRINSICHVLCKSKFKDIINDLQIYLHDDYIHASKTLLDSLNTYYQVQVYNMTDLM
jgi:predicted GIY-YIG superfamily endonuclease